MSVKEDFVKLNQKDPSLVGASDKKSPFFWIILIVVALITMLIIFVIVRTGASNSRNSSGKNDIQGEDGKKVIESGGKEDKVSTIKKDTAKTEIHPQLPLDISGKIQTIENLCLSGNLIEARKMLYELYDPRTQNEEVLEKIEELLGKVNIEIFNSDIPSPEKKLYTIEKGDVLVKIANKFNTTVESIQRANKINSGSHVIFPGKTLCIYEANWKIVVSKSKFTLKLFDGDRLFKTYKVGIGKQGRTPSGEFIISAKQKDPIWYNEGNAIPFGSPENILGTRWMALTPSGATDKNLKGYGIHGTWDNDSIGSASSNGCVRMKNEDIEELFSIIPQKITVIIED